MKSHVLLRITRCEDDGWSAYRVSSLVRKIVAKERDSKCSGALHNFIVCFGPRALIQLLAPQSCEGAAEADPTVNTSHFVPEVIFSSYWVSFQLTSVAQLGLVRGAGVRPLALFGARWCHLVISSRSSIFPAIAACSVDGFGLWMRFCSDVGLYRSPFTFTTGLRVSGSVMLAHVWLLCLVALSHGHCSLLLSTHLVVFFFLAHRSALVLFSQVSLTLASWRPSATHQPALYFLSFISAWWREHFHRSRPGRCRVSFW